MLAANFLTRPCTIRHRGSSGTDDYGNPLPAWTETDTLCELQQQQRDEPGTQGETSDTRWLLILPAGTVISGDDVVVVDDLAFEMVGDPWSVWDRLRGAAHHVEATVRRTA